MGNEKAELGAIAVFDGKIVGVGAEQAIRNAYSADEFIDLKNIIYQGLSMRILIFWVTH